MYNSSALAKSISVAGVDIGYDPKILTITAANIACSADFPNLANEKIDPVGKIVGLSCFIDGGNTLSIPAGNTSVLGTITFTAQSTAAKGTFLTISRTNVPDAVISIDLSDSGLGAKYVITRAGRKK